MDNTQLSEVGFSPAQIQTVKHTVAKNSTDEELFMFLTLAKKYNLDPFAKEIWFVKYGDQQPAIMTSRDGYLKVAQSHPDFLGLNSFVARTNDDLIIDPVTGQVSHKMNFKDRGEIVG